MGSKFSLLSDEEKEILSNIDGRTWEALAARRDEDQEHDYLDMEYKLDRLNLALNSTRTDTEETLLKVFDCLSKHLQHIAGIRDAEEEIAGIIPAYIQTAEKLEKIQRSHLDGTRAAALPAREKFYSDKLQDLQEKYDPAIYN